MSIDNPNNKRFQVEDGALKDPKAPDGHIPVSQTHMNSHSIEFGGRLVDPNDRGAESIVHHREVQVGDTHVFVTTKDTLRPNLTTAKKTVAKPPSHMPIVARARGVSISSNIPGIKVNINNK